MLKSILPENELEFFGLLNNANILELFLNIESILLKIFELTFIETLWKFRLWTSGILNSKWLFV